METSTKQRLLETGMAMLLEHGYSDLGIQQVLTATSVPKGSFYHHFKSKQDFALQVVDLYMTIAHGGLDACLGDKAVAPLTRVRSFFEATGESYGREGYLGCLLGGLGQELSGANEVFRSRIERCLQEISGRITSCLKEAIDRGDLRPDTDAAKLANLLVDCWEGAALRTRLLRDPAPLLAMLDFYFQSLMPADRSTQPAREPKARSAPRQRPRSKSKRSR